MIIPQETYHELSIILELFIILLTLLLLVQVSQVKFHNNWISNCETFAHLKNNNTIYALSLTCLLKMHPIKLEYDGTLTLWIFKVKFVKFSSNK